MDSGSDVLTQLSQQQEKFKSIQQKLDQPELLQVKQMLSTSECRSIFDELMKKPDLFLLLLASPLFALSLTENTRAWFLDNVQNHSEILITMLSKTDSSIPTSVTEEPAEQETDVLNNIVNLVGNLYLDTNELVTAYTPSFTSLLQGVNERLDGIGAALTCGMPGYAFPTQEGEQTTENNANSKKTIQKF